MTEVDDTALMERIARGRDHEAFAELYERHVRAAHSIALYVTGNAAMADDALQEGMLCVWRSAAQFTPGTSGASGSSGKVRAWIVRIVAREGIRLMKQKRGKAVVELSDERVSAEGKAASSDAVEHEERISALNGAMRGLPALERQLLALYYGVEMSQSEIGEELAMPNQTVSFRINKALESLRLNLTKAGFASVVPLVGAGILSEAMTRGPACPLATTEKLMQRIRLPENAARSLSRRGAKAKVAGGKWALGAVMAAAAVAGCFWMVQANSNAVPPQAAPPTKVESERPEFNYHWTFEENAPKEIVVREGTWTRNAQTRQMEARSMVRLKLPNPPHKPLLIQATIVFRGGASPKCGAMWSDGTKLLNCRIWRPTTAIALGKKGNHQIYLIGQFGYGFMDGKLTAVAEYDSAYPTDQIVLGITNLDTEELIFKEVKESELPAEVREDPRALIARRGWTSIDVPPQPLPPLENQN